jgi:TPR repeat protein
MKKKIILSLCLVFTALNANNVNNLAQSAQYANVSAQHNLRTQYKKTLYSKQDLLKAFKWYHKSAIKGHSASQYELALMFHYGLGVRQNAELARLWFTRASNKGHPKAQSILYRFYSVKKPQYFSMRKSGYNMNFRR